MSNEANKVQTRSPVIILLPGNEYHMIQQGENVKITSLVTDDLINNTQPINDYVAACTRIARLKDEMKEAVADEEILRPAFHEELKSI